MEEKTKRVDIEAKQVTPELWLVVVALVKDGSAINSGQFIMTESQLGFFNALRDFTGMEKGS